MLIAVKKRRMKCFYVIYFRQITMQLGLPVVVWKLSGVNGRDSGYCGCSQVLVAGEPQLVEHQQLDHPDYSQFLIDNIK